MPASISVGIEPGSNQVIFPAPVSGPGLKTPIGSAVRRASSALDNELKNKILDVTILENDTDNVIEFNSSFSDEIKDNKPRSFWNLLKTE